MPIFVYFIHGYAWFGCSKRVRVETWQPYHEVGCLGLVFPSCWWIMIWSAVRCPLIWATMSYRMYLTYLIPVVMPFLCHAWVDLPMAISSPDFHQMFHQLFQQGYARASPSSCGFPLWCDPTGVLLGTWSSSWSPWHPPASKRGENLSATGLHASKNAPSKAWCGEFLEVFLNMYSFDLGLLTIISLPPWLVVLSHPSPKYADVASTVVKPASSSYTSCIFLLGFGDQLHRASKPLLNQVWSNPRVDTQTCGAIMRPTPTAGLPASSHAAGSWHHPGHKLSNLSYALYWVV